MPRNKRKRFLQFMPSVTYFKPRGVPLRQLQSVLLQADELEALKLYEVDGFDQITAAKHMKISQPTFARIVALAHKKIATAVIYGHAIQVESKEA